MGHVRRFTTKVVLTVLFPCRYLSKWCEDWRQDLDARSPDVKNSGPGHQATIKFEETMVYMKPLFRQLKRGSLIPEMRAGLWIIVQVGSRGSVSWVRDQFPGVGTIG